MHHFDTIFESNSVQIFVNASVGDKLQLDTLSHYYDAVVLCTGMSDSKRNWSGIPNCFGADEVFGWYNKNPRMMPFSFDLSKAERLVIIGNGNVALDMARIFSKDTVRLANDELDKQILDTLMQSKLKEITILGRRDLLQVSINSVISLFTFIGLLYTRRIT